MATKPFLGQLQNFRDHIRSNLLYWPSKSIFLGSQSGDFRESEAPFVPNRILFSQLIFTLFSIMPFNLGKYLDARISNWKHKWLVRGLWLCREARFVNPAAITEYTFAWGRNTPNKSYYINVFVYTSIENKVMSLVMVYNATYDQSFAMVENGTLLYFLCKMINVLVQNTF